MIEKQVLMERLQSYLTGQIDKMALSNPLVGFMRPLISRALSKNFGKISKAIDLITDENGKVDIEGILSEMVESVMGSDPFTINTKFIGNIEVGRGSIRLNIPMTDKRLVFNQSDIQEFRDLLTSK